MPMPTPFLWGVATSSYQIEGAPDNDWVEWERLGRLRVRDERCGGATGHRERWRSDFDLLASLGANAYRFSLERSVLEPVRGWFSEEALLRERARVDVARGVPAALRPLRSGLRDARAAPAALGRPLRRARPAIHRGRSLGIFRRFSKVTNPVAPADRARASVRS
jgi:hypothetical protein